MAFDSYNKEAITFPGLVLRQIKIIQDICKSELRNKTKIIKNLVGEQTIEEEDTRQSYIQSIDVLGSMLSPYFNGDVKEHYEDLVELYQMELIEAIKNEDFISNCSTIFNIKKEEIKEKVINDEKIKNSINLYFLNEKIRSARLLFTELIQCMKDNRFLEGESYGESGKSEDSMDAVDDDLEEINEEVKDGD